MSQRNIRQRIREISLQINDLSIELDRLLHLEDNNTNSNNNQESSATDFSREPQIDDIVEITNSYIGLFGATRGSIGRITEIQENRVSIRLENNGRIVSRGVRNVRVVNRGSDGRRATQ